MATRTTLQKQIDRLFNKLETMEKEFDALLTEYMGIDAQIEAGMHNDPEFFGSYKYYQFQAKKTELGTAHTKLTNALVALETYLK